MRTIAWTLTAVLAIATAATAKAPKVGEPAPEFTIRLTDNSIVRLDDLKGQVVLLNFWATWCVPCKKELPTLDAYYRVARDHGMRAFAITTEDSVPVSQLKPLAALMAMPMVKGIKGPYAPIGGAVPSNFIIDRAGVVRYAKAGAFNLDELNRLLPPLINEAPPRG